MSRTLFKTTALLTLGLAFSSPQSWGASAQVPQKPVLTVLHRFDFTHGADPQTTLTRGADGNLYGVTFFGGLELDDNDPNTGIGTVFSMTPSGHFTTLWRFNETNGAFPVGALVQGKDGDFYGTTEEGGKNDSDNGGDGTVYRITPQGRLTTLHAFNSAEGDIPIAGLTLAPDGSFYGTTTQGGAHTSGGVFHMTAAGTVTPLHTFAASDGPCYSALVFGSDGALYGMNSGAAGAYGNVFRLTTDGAYSTLHTFHGDDGTGFGGLTLGTDGALYGVSYAGGIDFGNFSPGDGVLFKITPAGLFTTLHKFSADGHGANPLSALTLGMDGDFYGTTVNGGQTNGTVFQMTPAGAVTTLYKFHTASDEHTPFGGVVFGTNGALYGTTETDNIYSGTIFKLTLP